MNRILSFSDWLSEDLEYPSFPSDWQDLPEWKLLHLMGFEVSGTNPKTGTITLQSSYSGKPFRLTSSGYVRVSKQGYIYTTKVKEPMPRLLGYMIGRFAKQGIPLVPDEQLDALVKQNPRLITYLSSLPKLKQAVMQRTGEKDPAEEYYSQYGINYSTVKWLDKCTKGTWELDPATGEINVSGSFTLQNSQSSLGLRGLKFGIVEGSFQVEMSELTSLEGSPREVGGDFSCYSNNLTSLKGSPLKVGGNFNCTRNPLTTLEGAPAETGGDFICDSFRINHWTGAKDAFYKIISGDADVIIHNHSLRDGAAPNKEKALGILISTLDLDQMSQVIREYPKLISKIPPQFQEEVAKGAGYSSEEIKAIEELGDYGIF